MIAPPAPPESVLRQDEPDRRSATRPRDEMPAGGKRLFGRPRRSIAFKLTLVVSLTVGALLAAVLLGSGYYWREVLRTQVNGHLSALALSRRDMVKGQLDLLMQRVALQTDRGEIRGFMGSVALQREDAPNQRFAQATLDYDATLPPVTNMYLVNTSGKVVLAHNPAELGKDIRATSEFQSGIHEPHVSWPRFENGRFISTVVAPVRSRAPGNELLGALVGTVELKSLASVTRDMTAMGKSGVTLLGVTQGDDFVFLFPPADKPELRSLPIASAPILTSMAAGQPAFLHQVDYRGVPVLVARQPIGYRGWWVLVKVDESEAYAPALRASRLLGGAGLALLAVGTLIASALAIRFSRPVRQLAAGAAKVAEGDYSSQVPVESKDELGTLAESFNKMILAIRTRGEARELAEQALQDSERSSRQITESLPQLVWTCNATGALDYLGPQWSAYTGAPLEPQLGSGWLVQVHPDDRALLVEHWAAMLRDGKNLDVDFRIRRYDGAYRWFHTRATPLRDEAGVVTKWFGTSTDIQGSKEAEAALREADRRKDEFIAMLGHELRNPLAAISNSVRLVRESEDGDPDTAIFAQRVIERQTAHLQRLVEDLMDVARITEGKIELAPETLEVANAVSLCTDTLRPMFMDHLHSLQIESNEQDFMLVQADPTRLEQIVANLLTNAAKYTPDGGQIVVAAFSDSGQAVIEVRDNGIGIQPDMLGKIFDLFTQADHSLDRPSGGLGIGLNISRKLAEMHGGTLTAHSAGLGSGSIFTLRLPLVKQTRPRAGSGITRRTLANACHHRILLVDDNVDTARSLSLLLTKRGHEVAIAHDGMIALKMAYEFQPEVFLLDLGLPGMDGFSLARRLRAGGFGNAPMFAISGYAQAADVERARLAGFDRHFPKPVDFDELAALLATELSEMVDRTA